MAPHHAFLFAAALASASAPGDCPDSGARAVPARWEPGPPLGCRYDPASPAWDLFTPPHRVAAARPGFAPGDARARARLLVVYRCTGLRLVPKVVAGIRTLGYVLDLDERRCCGLPGPTGPVTGS